jgi:DNA-binding NtrC family response regulator
MRKLLVIDDDRTVLRLTEKAFADVDLQILSASDGEKGIELINREKPDVLLLDIRLPGISGLELAKQIRQIDSKLPVIFITASDESDVAIEAMKLGAYEYLLKPLDMVNVQNLVERALDTRRQMLLPVLMQESAELPNVGDALVGCSPTMLEVYKQIGRVAAQNVAVMIRGESGTGKELIARAIYQHSHRNSNCYLAVNCAALSDTLLESELFGHEKGAFTGADRRHIGKFEQCNGGTIFLDEVGDMSPLTQAKVLRLLQEKKFERVGGKETIEVDVRVISATNRPLERMIKDNEFRLDLYHRLNAFEIHLPALRDRELDIDLLTKHFLAMFNRELGKKISGFSNDALSIIRSYRWPGNIRELQSVVRKSMLMATGPVILTEFLPAEIVKSSKNLEVSTETAEWSVAGNGAFDLASFIDSSIREGRADLYAETLIEMERILIGRILQHHSGNQSRAAEQLGITRGSLRNKIRSLGISIDQVVVSND